MLRIKFHYILTKNTNILNSYITAKAGSLKFNIPTVAFFATVDYKKLAFSTHMIYKGSPADL